MKDLRPLNRISAFAALLSLLACHHAPAAREDAQPSRAITVLTPPPSEEMTRVRVRMWQLAREVRLLAMLIDAPDQADSDAREHLQNMETIAREIAALPERRNHPILDKNIDAFIADIERAKAEVAGEEPETGMTRSITTTCVRCHELRTCPFDSYRQCADLPVY